jgi:hypothetical protein
MQFEAPTTVAAAISQIEDREYLIPALQRSFVWKPAQVERLLDSLMRDYPIGSFLFWKVPPRTVERYPFFEFCSDVTSGDSEPVRAKHCAAQPIAVIDGQQRLTAFLIAAGGSYSWPGRGRAGMLKHQLYIDLLGCNEEAGEDDLRYQFHFLTQEAAAAASPDGQSWFLVADAFRMKDATEIFRAIQERGLADDPTAFHTLNLLHQSLHEKAVINYYLEKSDDISRVLNIFARLNRGGTALSYPDLLVSAATLNWQCDARQEFADAVRSLNMYGFGFKKDRVLKAAMVLADMKNLKFKADSFTPDQASKIESDWREVRRCLPIAAKLLRSFGLNQSNLTAENVIIPVAYYITFVVRHADHGNRELVRSFVIRSLLKGSFWTGAVDVVLTETRRILQENSRKGFPLDDIDKVLARLKKPLTFSDDEIEVLLQTHWGRRQVMLLLSLLYPGVDLTEQYHQDHVFPRSLLTDARLRRAGLSSEEISGISDLRDQLPNLQLLRGELNLEKSKKHPLAYAHSIHPAAKRDEYLASHDLQGLPAGITADVLSFLKGRQAVMRTRLRMLLPK